MSEKDRADASLDELDAMMAKAKKSLGSYKAAQDEQRALARRGVDAEERQAAALERIADAAERGPVFVFIPTDAQPDQIRRMVDELKDAMDRKTTASDGRERGVIE